MKSENLKSQLNFDQLSVHSKPEQSLGFLLWQVSYSWRRRIEEILEPLNLTHPQFVMLATIGWLTRQGQRASQIQVGRQAGFDPNTTSQILRSLQLKKWITRSRGPDERSKYPQLTPTGADLVSQALPLVERVDADFFAPVCSQREKVLEILQALTRRP